MVLQSPSQPPAQPPRSTSTSPQGRRRSMAAAPPQRRQRACGRASVPEWENDWAPEHPATPRGADGEGEGEYADEAANRRLNEAWAVVKAAEADTSLKKEADKDPGEGILDEDEKARYDELWEQFMTPRPGEARDARLRQNVVPDLPRISCSCTAARVNADVYRLVMKYNRSGWHRSAMGMLEQILTYLEKPDSLIPAWLREPQLRTLRIDEEGIEEAGSSSDFPADLTQDAGGHAQPTPASAAGEASSSSSAADGRTAHTAIDLDAFEPCADFLSRLLSPGGDGATARGVKREIEVEPRGRRRRATAA